MLKRIMLAVIGVATVAGLCAVPSWQQSAFAQPKDTTAGRKTITVTATPAGQPPPAPVQAAITNVSISTIAATAPLTWTVSITGQSFAGSGGNATCNVVLPTLVEAAALRAEIQNGRTLSVMCSGPALPNTPQGSAVVVVQPPGVQAGGTSVARITINGSP